MVKAGILGTIHILGLAQLWLMTKFMPVLKMQIYFLSVAWYKKALGGTFALAASRVGWGDMCGGLGVYDHNARLEEFNTVCHNQWLIREKPERK